MNKTIRCTWWQFTGESADIDSPSGNTRVSVPLLRNLETGEIRHQHQLPAGALFAVPREASDGAELHRDRWPPAGPDGLSIVCLVPGSCSGGVCYWYIDSRASNCTRRDDPAHRCWVRHGTIGEALHVDKNGNTCSAGAGSISMPGYHGFLHGGQLVEC